MAENNEIVVDVDNLVAHYGDRQILFDINMKVLRGETHVIMGGSGSGKSTLLRILLGLKKPTSGLVKLLENDIANASQKELYALRKHMGVAFQGGALFGSMSLADNVQLPLKEHTKLDKKTMDVMTRMKLEVVNLAGFENLMPSELSGGMLKRAAIARAIIMDPSILFLDEPSAGLDPIVSAELDELIIKLKKATKMTTVVVTHELESAFKIADRITILHHGHILISDSVDAVKASPDKRIQDLLNRRPRDEKIDAEDYLKRLVGE